MAIAISSANLGAYAWADDVASMLAPLVNDDTFLAARLDVAALSVLGSPSDLIKALPMLSSSPDAPSWLFASRVAEGVIKRFRDAGGQNLYIVAGLADVRVGGGPLMIATANTSKNSQDVERMLNDVIREIVFLRPSSDGSAWADQIAVKRKGDAVLVGMKLTVNRYLALKPSGRSELLQPLAKLADDGAVVAAVFCPGSDYRRVSRELWPELYGTLAPRKGELADRWQHFEFAINAAPNVRPRIALQARDAEAAEVFAKLWRSAPEAVTEYSGQDRTMEATKAIVDLVVNAMPASVEGTRAEIAIPTSANEIGKLSAVAAQLASKSMERQHQVDRMNKFKQIMLGMWNFESANKHLPPAAICDKNGKPLLSWRVAILPYVGENELYKQFHLDEPWDSAHNRPLVAKMPEIYADSDGALQVLRGEGKSTFQVPVGPETIFHDNRGSTARDITDGTSQTIALVEVVPERAVVWTQPEDWAVDLAHPKQGLERSDRSYIVAARCDGSAHTIPLSTDDKTLRALLTRNGGEMIDGK